MTVRKLEVKPRRTQQARREDMRRRLLEATLDCVQEVGLAQASTPMICARAGVSRGALTHHYPSRAALVAAAIDHATNAALDGLDQALTSSAPGRHAVESFCAAIWRTTEGPLFAVALEFLVAARHDSALWPVLQEGRQALERQVAERLADVLRRAGLPPDHPRGAPLLASGIFLVRGVALQRYAGTDPAALRAAFDAWRDMASDVIAACAHA